MFIYPPPLPSRPPSSNSIISYHSLFPYSFLYITFKLLFTIFLPLKFSIYLSLLFDRLILLFFVLLSFPKHNVFELLPLFLFICFLEFYIILFSFTSHSSNAFSFKSFLTLNGQMEKTKKNLAFFLFFNPLVFLLMSFLFSSILSAFILLDCIKLF